MTGLNLLITGGAGCLGSNLIEHLLPLGWNICVIDNFATGRREVVPPTSGLMVIEGDIANADLVDRVFDEFQPTHVVHSAASYKDPRNWLEDISTNVSGSANVVHASERHSVRKLVNFQTALCYGRPAEVPIRSDSQLSPFTSYGISKTAGEQYLLQAEVPTVSLRLANICGPRLAIGPIPTFYQRLKDGKDCFCSDTVRDFLHIDDFFSLMEIVMQDESPTGVFNVSTGEGHTILDVYREVSLYLGLEVQDVPVVPPGDDDVPAVVLEPSATERAFNWTAKVDFTETIHRQLDWYDKYGVSEVFSHLQHNGREEA